MSVGKTEISKTKSWAVVLRRRGPRSCVDTLRIQLLVMCFNQKNLERSVREDPMQPFVSLMVRTCAHLSRACLFEGLCLTRSGIEIRITRNTKLYHDIKFRNPRQGWWTLTRPIATLKIETPKNDIASARRDHPNEYRPHLQSLCKTFVYQDCTISNLSWTSHRHPKTTWNNKYLIIT